MNRTAIDRFINSIEVSDKSVKTRTNGNENNKGKKYRRGKLYARDIEVERQNYIKKQQRKRGKVDYRRGQYVKKSEVVSIIDGLNKVKTQSHANTKETKQLINAALNEIQKYQTRDNASYVTTRRYEMPTDEDMKLENLHYANFLGDKYGDNNAPYQKSSVKLNFCDSLCDENNEKSVSTTEAEDGEWIDNVTVLYRSADWDAEEEDEYINEEVEQSKNYCVNALMREGNFDYDEAEQLVDYLFKDKHTKEFNDAHWLPWLQKFGITPRDLYGESYYC